MISKILKFFILISLFFPAYAAFAQEYQVPVIFHIARTDSGLDPRADADDVDAMVANLNDAYLAASIEFQLCEIRYVDNNDLHTNFDGDEDDVLAAIDYKEKVINLVILGYSSIHGHSNFPSGMLDLVEIDYEEIATTTLIHEMGHYFGLLHCYSYSRGYELADGSNCHTAGDMVCDTPASPGGLDFNDDTCAYTGNAEDYNGNFYEPEGRNYMSDAENGCRDRFSLTQLIRIEACMKLERYYLLNDCVPSSLSNLTCSDLTSIVSFPHNDNFDKNLNDSWMIDSEADFGFSCDGRTKSTSSGANQAQSGYYFRYLDTSDFSYMTAGLISPGYDLSEKSSADVTFYYNMHGSDTGNLSLQVTANNGTTWTDLFSKDGQQHDSGDEWEKVVVSLDDYVGGEIQLRFRGTSGKNSDGDISIDNVTVDADEIKKEDDGGCFINSLKY